MIQDNYTYSAVCIAIYRMNHNFKQQYTFLNNEPL